MSRRLAAAAAAALALGACHRRAPPPDLSLDPAALLAEVQAAQARLQTVQGTARVGVDAPGAAGASEHFLAAQRPGRLRVESRDFFGNVAAVLAVDGETLSLYDARERVLYRGAATAENVGRLVPVAVAPADLVLLLLGTVPLLDGAPEAAEPGDGRVTLTVRQGQLVQRLAVGPGAALLASRMARAGPDGAEVPAGLAADFSVHRTTAGTRFPTDVRVRATAERVSMELSWREATVNQPVEPGLFRLSPPRGARVVDLDPPPP